MNSTITDAQTTLKTHRNLAIIMMFRTSSERTGMGEEMQGIPAGSGHEIFMGILGSEGERMLIALKDIRRKYSNPGVKGDQSELILREFLGRYLPASNRVGHGEVFNIEGLRSKQTDLVITNEYHTALTNDWSEAQAFILEGIECAGEIKSSINSTDDLRDCHDKARAFKQMFICPDHVDQARSSEKNTHFLWRKPYFGFAFDSRLTFDTIARNLNLWNQEERPIERPMLDGLFILNGGCLLFPGVGRLAFERGDDSKRDRYRLVSGVNGRVLSTLLLWINGVMPGVSYSLHPLVSYLSPDSRRGKMSLTDEGRLRV